MAIFGGSNGLGSASQQAPDPLSLTAELSRFGLFDVNTAVPGVKFGQTPSLAAGTSNVDVWNGGTLYTGQPTGAAETVMITSSSALDTGSVTITGIDDSDMIAQETIAINGIVPVVTVSLWKRVYRARYISSTVNQGDITIQHSLTTANVFAVMPTGYGSTKIAAISVPANKYIVAYDPFATLTRSNGGAGAAEISVRLRLDGLSFVAERSYNLTSGAPLPSDPGSYPVICPPLSDLVVRVESVSDSSSIINVQFEYTTFDALP